MVSGEFELAAGHHGSRRDFARILPVRAGLNEKAIFRSDFSHAVFDGLL